METKDTLLSSTEQIRLQIVLELLRQGVNPNVVQEKAESLVKFVSAK